MSTQAFYHIHLRNPPPLAHSSRPPLCPPPSLPLPVAPLPISPSPLPFPVSPSPLPPSPLPSTPPPPSCLPSPLPSPLSALANPSPPPHLPAQPPSCPPSLDHYLHLNQDMQHLLLSFCLFKMTLRPTIIHHRVILHLSSKFQPIRPCGSAIHRRTLRQTTTCFIGIDLGIGMYSIFYASCFTGFFLTLF